MKITPNAAYRMVLTTAICLLVLEATGCRGVHRAKYEEQLFGIRVAHNQKTGEQYNSQGQQARCISNGGTWAHFQESCANYCRPQVLKMAGKKIACTNMQVESCQCPEGYCWSSRQQCEQPKQVALKYYTFKYNTTET